MRVLGVAASLAGMNTKRKVIAGAAAVLAVAGGGAAVAASWPSPSERSKAVIDDAAQQLGVSSAKLTDALKQALEDQIDADVAAGRITQAQADAMKQRIESGDFPLFGGGPGFGKHMLHGGDEFEAAATYLGLTPAELKTQLQSGKTLAQIADATSGKSAAGLIDALVAAEQKEHPDAPAAEIRQRITDLVNGTFRAHPRPDFGPPGIE
jgi:hypothetical protein